MVTTTDAENSSAPIVYTLTIAGVPTPSDEISNMYPTVMIINNFTPNYKASVRTIG